ncbi:MAG: STAS domain-containing protein [Spirochaetes bacterium]|nr:STAS domain-containing protein [Spirochaetota bacterium]
MRTKTFKFLHPPDASMVDRLRERVGLALREPIETLRIDLTACHGTSAPILDRIAGLAEEVRDRFNKEIEILRPVGPEADVAHDAAPAPLPEPDAEGIAELRLADHGIQILDLAVTDRFKDLTRKIHAAGAKRIFINFSGVRSVNAGGIMTLVKLKRELSVTGGELMLLIPDDSRVYDILRANNLTEEFRIGFTR